MANTIPIPSKLPTDPRKAYRRGWRDGRRQNAASGGKARAARLSPERRKEIADIAIAARWGKRNATIESTDTSEPTQRL